MLKLTQDTWYMLVINSNNSSSLLLFESKKIATNGLFALIKNRYDDSDDEDVGNDDGNNDGNDGDDDAFGASIDSVSSSFLINLSGRRGRCINKIEDDKK